MVLSDEVTSGLLNEDQFNLETFIRDLPDNLQSAYLLDCKNQLQKSLTTVTHEISESILKHQPIYIGELQRVTDLNKSIIDCIRICGKGRSSLRFIKNCPTLLKHYRERESLKKLLSSLTEISNLRKSIMEMQNLIDCQDYSRAIQMCKDSQVQLASFDKYECINDIGSKLENTLMLIGDSVISKLCTTDYDPTTYPELRDAYFQLDRCDIAVDRALDFFISFHTSSVDELKMFLDNETWEMLPVKSDFNVMQLKEFSFLRHDTNSNSTEDLFGSDQQQHQQELPHPHQASYFDQPDALPLDRISLSSDSDLDAELGKEFIDEDEVTEIVPQLASVSGANEVSPNRLTKTAGPVLTNSSLNVLRLAGRYIQMMNVLSPISFEILMNIYKLLDQYTIFVYRKFGSDNDKKLEDVIASLRANLIGGQQNIESASAMLSQQVRSSNSRQAQQPIYMNKAVAIESLIFLVNQLWNLHEYLITLITPEQQVKLREQFSQNNSTIPNFLKARAELAPSSS